MLVLPNYTIKEKLHQGRNSLVLRAIQEPTKKKVVIKFLNIEYPTPNQITRFKREYEIVKQLYEVLGEQVLRPYELIAYQNTYAMILEDFGAASLAKLLRHNPLGIEQFLHLAITIADIIGKIHGQHILIKDINPSNILWNPDTDVLKLIDFDMATTLSFENHEAGSPNTIEGTLPYISPELTRRMNRLVDYRSDYYSLGITFYEMLVGFYPFQTQNLMELVHAHIAKIPKAPHEILPSIPITLSAIVMKLLNKTPEDRYQSSHGLIEDLKKCEYYWLNNHTIPEFPIATHDISSNLHISEKLYGRQDEIQILMNTFAHVSQGEKKLMLISGYSGIGKSALVKEVYKPIAEQEGYFISGKCDQFKRDIPYEGLVQALKKLVEQILTEPPDKILHWKHVIQKAVGHNGQVVIEVIPQIKGIIGPQPELIDVGPTETRNRFSFVFQNFIRAFASEHRPLTIFLDDLQWVDLPTLELLSQLLLDPQTHHLFIIGAYRSNEVNPYHILMLALDNLKEAGFDFETLYLSPLHIQHVRQLLVDTFHCSEEKVTSLAEIVYTKTQGNPFFINRLILSLFEDGFITFDLKEGLWSWDLENIKKKDISDNVVEFMSGKILKLPQNTQNALKLAACLGNRFDLKILSQVNEKTLQDTLSDLWVAMQEGLIIAEDENYKFVNDQMSEEVPCHFLHDRVQQAVYSLIPEPAKKSLHYKIGQILISTMSKEKIEEKVFEIIFQLNLSTHLIKNESEKIQLIKLNLHAAKKAKASSAFKAALNYLKIAYELLPIEAWSQYYSLTFDLMKEYGGCLYILGEHEKAEVIIDETLKYASSAIEKAEIISMQVTLYRTTAKMHEAILAGLKGLGILGMHVPLHPSKWAVLKDFLLSRWYIGRRSIASLIDMPELKDPKLRLTTKLIQESSIAIYYTGNTNLTALMILKQINVFLRNGNYAGSGLAYNAYAMFLNSFGNLKEAYAWGKLSLELCEKLHDEQFKSRTFMTYALMIHGWNFHWKTLSRYFQEAIESGMQSGDLLTSSHGCSNILLWNPELSLDTVISESPKYLDFIKDTRNQNNWDATKLQLQLRANLNGRTDGLFSLSDLSFDERECLVRMEASGFSAGIAMYHVNKSIIHYHYGDFANSLNYLKLGEKGMQTFFGTLFYIEYTIYTFHIHAAMYPQLKGWERRKSWKMIVRSYKKLKKWARHCPVNFLHHQLIMEAELARLLNKEEKATLLYDQAIADANQQHFIRDEALANELALAFYQSLGKQKIAKLYFQEARYCYQRWGAHAKVKYLEDQYPQFLAPHISSTPLTETSTTTDSTTTHLLDFLSVMKASQSLAREIHLPNLIEKMMQAVIENAGAEKGYLLLEKNGDYVIEAIVDQEKVQILPSLTINDLPVSIIQTVATTKTSVVIEDATEAENLYFQDPYVRTHKPKSILCVPLLNLGEIKGMLYLENNLASHIFTQERLDIINMLSTQMAISINNATFYGQLEDMVLKRTKALQDTQNQLIQKEKMAFLGLLTTGIAHEIKNPLNFIINFSLITESSLDDFDRLLKEPHSKVKDLQISQMMTILRDNIGYIKNQGKKADAIVSRMLEHSSTQSPVFALTDIHALIERVISIYQLQMPKQYSVVSVLKILDPSTPYVEIVEMDIQRVLMNLLDNAYYAVFQKRQKQGDAFIPQISIQTRDLFHSVEIRVKDNGMGIAEEFKQKIFTPFFSTKPPGQGVGLGLSLCYNIIAKEHGGTFTFNSIVGEYTEFVLSLPRQQNAKGYFSS